MITRSLSRLLESEVQAWEDTEMTIEEFIKRTDECLAMLKGLNPVTFVGKEKTVISMPMGDSIGKKFILGFGVLDDYFHLSMVHAILRMKGVPLGKAVILSPWHRAEA